VSRRVYNLDEVDRFVLGTVGQPGEREFFIQVRKAGQVFSFSLEKTQAQALTQRGSYYTRGASKRRRAIRYPCRVGISIRCHGDNLAVRFADD
jgi:hypothetical protein